MEIVVYLISVAALLLRTGLGIRQFKDEYPGITVCESSLTDTFVYQMPDSYKFLKGHLGGLHNCTHIEGNLVIVNVGSEDSKEPDMSFLESVVEVTGMVVMRNNVLKKVILPNLRIIRGEKYINSYWYDRKKYPVSLYLQLIDETNSGHAIFPSLKVISNNSVFFWTQKPQKYLPHSIRWEELFENADQRLFVLFNQTERLPCHESCNAAVPTNLPKHCWSSSPDHCQARTKCIERRSDGCQWCHFVNVDNRTMENCCSSQCSGGCQGITARDCTVCKNYINGDACVLSCPPEFIISSGKKKRNPDYKLRVGMICAKKCPDNLLHQEDACIYKCTVPQFYRSEDRCLPCTSTAMCDKKECIIDKFRRNTTHTFYMTKEILEQFTDCEEVIGEFHFDVRSFNKTDGKITVPMLYKHLKKVEFITGDLKINGLNVSMQNLTFLENLKEIRHQLTNTGTASLNIISTDLEFLGLRRLRYIYGKFEEHENSALCYMDSLPWKKHILRSYQYPPVFKNCNKSCDPQCGSFGCWGPSSTMCYGCKSVRAAPNCVDRCEDEPGFYTHNTTKEDPLLVYDDGSCKRCHPFCLQNCTGPGPKDCSGGCRFFREGDSCVKQCSNWFYPIGSTCHSCNESCSESPTGGVVCTGNGSHIGEGGCSFCYKFMRTDSSSLVCYGRKTCPSGFYVTRIPADEIQPKYPILQVDVCEPCLRPCSKCSGNSTTAADCESCTRGYWSDNICVWKCDSDRLVMGQNVSVGKECPYCHDQCRIGCFSPHNASQCKDCKTLRLLINRDLKQIECVERCPPSHNYTYTEGTSKNILCVNKSQWDQHSSHQRYLFIRKVFLMILGPILVVLLAILLSIGLHFYRANREKSIHYLRAIYSNILEPDSRVLLNKKDPPNMNRLLLIPTTNLIFNMHDKPLGTGAFGAVYRGVWKFSSSSEKKSNDNNTLAVAIKVIQGGRDIKINDILEEAKVMASVSHKHCLRLIGVCLKYEMPCLVISYVELGSLDKYLRKHKNSLSSYVLLSWAEQISNGMAYLEMRNIIHRDLATRNVLLNNSHLVQITDFGLSHILQGSDTNHEIVITSGQVPIRWLAIETLISGIYSHKTDVWAFGVTLWEIFTYGERPYDELEAREITPFLLQNNRLQQPEICSLELYVLMTRCWSENAQDRPSFDELMTILLNYSRHSTYYLNISNDPCLTSHGFRKQRLSSQYSYEMHQYPGSKSFYKQQSMDGTVSTYDGDYQDALLESSLRRQSSNFSWTSNRYRFSEDMERKSHLIRHQSALSENPEENENVLESGELDPLNDGYLEPIRK